MEDSRRKERLYRKINCYIGGKEPIQRNYMEHQDVYNLCDDIFKLGTSKSRIQVIAVINLKTRRLLRMNNRVWSQLPEG